MPIDIKNSLDAGFDEYITKPIDVSKLLVTVENLPINKSKKG